MERMSARGTVLRTVAPIPHAFALNVVDVAGSPRSLSTPSLRGTEVPTMRFFAGVLMIGEVRNAVRVDA